MPSGFDEIAPAGYAWAVTPSDSADMAKEARAIYVGTDGNVALKAYDPATNKLATVVFTAVLAGTILPVRTPRVMNTSTTATSIVALA